MPGQLDEKWSGGELEQKREEKDGETFANRGPRRGDYAPHLNPKKDKRASAVKGLITRENLEEENVGGREMGKRKGSKTNLKIDGGKCLGGRAALSKAGRPKRRR